MSANQIDCECLDGVKWPVDELNVDNLNNY